MPRGEVEPLAVIPLSDSSNAGSNAASKAGSKPILTGIARLSELAKSKPIPPNFIEDRRSVYWTDAPLVVSKNYQLNMRSCNLASAKMPHRDHRGDRPSPIWKVTPAARRARPSGRVALLASPKEVHPDWFQDQPVATVINRRALNAVPSGRLIQLARPKVADSRYIAPSISLTQLDILKDDNPRKFNRKGKVVEVPDSCPDFVDRLCPAKGMPKGFKEDRPIKWAIYSATKNATISDRVDYLSKLRRVGKRGEDDIIIADPYKVSRGAMKASATDRIGELSTPIARKLRQKCKQ